MIRSIDYISSNPDIKGCPQHKSPEYAFIGRSNVGKSSLINMLAGRKIAYTSNNPGKTQAINHFLVNKDWYLVDLPGYGYAKVSKKQRKKWDDELRTYLLMREELTLLFVLVDSRHNPMKVDIEFINWLGFNGIPFSIVFTKTDKINESKLKENTELYKNELYKTWDELPKMFYTSSFKSTGGEEIVEYIIEINNEIQKNSK